MPNDCLKRTCNSDDKCRFFTITPILAPFLAQNTKIAISLERVDRFQKFLRSKTLYPRRFYDKNLDPKLRPTWTGLR